MGAASSKALRKITRTMNRRGVQMSAERIFIVFINLADALPNYTLKSDDLFPWQACLVGSKIVFLINYDRSGQ